MTSVMIYGFEHMFVFIVFWYGISMSTAKYAISI